MTCSRRGFLQSMASCMAGGVFGMGGGLFKLPGTQVSYSAAGRAAVGGNIVVFVQMFGGNDGLNMIYPLNGKQRTNYEAFRPTLALPNQAANFQPWVTKGIGGAQALDIGVNADGSHYAFNPGMGALNALYQSGKVAVIPGVHYPAPNHSHSDSTSVYISADTSGANGTGWFGKYLNTTAYTEADVPSVIMGTSQTPLFTPSNSGILTFEDLNLLQFPAIGDAAFDARIYSAYCGLAGTRDAASYPELIQIAQLAGSTISHLGEFYNPKNADGTLLPAKVQALLIDANGDYNHDNPLVYSSPLNPAVNPAIASNDLATDLKHVAAVIRANIGARFFHVGLNSFDTHSNQEQNLNHSTLLNMLSEGIAAFYNEMNQAVSLPGLTGYQTGNLSQNVIIVTFSEFGRTMRQNDTDPNQAGTDHAASAPQMVIGGKVLGGKQYGAYPQLDDPGFEAKDDLKMSTDFRNVFGTILDKWLGVPVPDLGPGPGSILNSTPAVDGDGNSYTAYAPMPFLP